MESESEPATCCKIGRVLQAYELDGLDADLASRWTGADGESASLRDLEAYVNRELIREALVAAGVSPVDGEPENLRRILRSGEVSESRRLEAIRRLKGDGVAVEQLLDDFVSHQTVHTHLRECKEIDPPAESTVEERIGQAESTIFGLLNRTEAVASKNLSQLGNNGVLSPDSYDVVVSMQVICEECGRTHNVQDLLASGGCSCSE